MRETFLPALLLLVCGLGPASRGGEVFTGERRLNNLVSELVEVTSISAPGRDLVFERSSDGWIFVSVQSAGQGQITIRLDDTPGDPLMVSRVSDDRSTFEAMRFLSKGQHRLRAACEGDSRITRLSIKAIPELIHCGLGFNSQIKSYGLYDMDFLRKEIVPNVTTMIIPANLELPKDLVEGWHNQRKRFVGEVGVDSKSHSAEEHARYWTGFFDRAPLLDGLIIEEFIVNYPLQRREGALSPERQARVDRERSQYEQYAEALEQIRADKRYKDKLIYNYFGGSGKKLNQEIIGTNLVRTIIRCGYRVALERYLHEMSTEEGSAMALKLFVDGVADWEAKEPGVLEQMVIAFGLFSMPPGGLNKQPDVDYHVWMDQQMNTVANNPVFRGLGGLEWWTTSLADEETVRFVGRLYRHYAIEGKTNRLTTDPLFLTHVLNPDFRYGTRDWTLHAAEEGAITTNRFPRFGRIEGRFMGLGRPADPEHIGDAFLCLKRSSKGPNTFSQTIKDLEPGRLYSMKMFSCDYDDLVHPKPKRIENAQTAATVLLDGVDLDAKRSFDEVYASNPEPKIPVCIKYCWRVFRAKGTNARLTVSDWKNETEPGGPIGQEQAFNFIEVEPYHE